MFRLAEELFPIHRSITGKGTMKTLIILQRELPGLQTHIIRSGTKVFDWEIPKEWNVRNAYIEDSVGRKICDFKENNLHIVQYSTPVDRIMSLEELDLHLHSKPDQPDAIPYITSYYKDDWGFCITHKQREELKKGDYHVFIDSTLEEGWLPYGELILPGQTQMEVLISTYICHPSMANDNLSGIVVATELAKWLSGYSDRFYTYRFVFVPETIGSLAWLYNNWHVRQNKVAAGFVITHVGHGDLFSFVPSRNGDTLADKVAFHVLQNLYPNFIWCSFRDRGSDERQYCAPGIDLPVVSIMRSRYGTYPEYHTSLDNLDFIKTHALASSLDIYRRVINCLEANVNVSATQLGEPNLGKRGLYPTTSTGKIPESVKTIKDVLAYADGRTLLEIADRISEPMWMLYPIVDKLGELGLIDTYRTDVW